LPGWRKPSWHHRQPGADLPERPESVASRLGRTPGRSPGTSTRSRPLPGTDGGGRGVVVDQTRTCSFGAAATGAVAMPPGPGPPGRGRARTTACR
jgi:hypothetical protein